MQEFINNNNSTLQLNTSINKLSKVETLDWEKIKDWFNKE